MELWDHAYAYKSGHIFLYQGVLSAHTGIHTPVVQMLSEKHNIDSIANWLIEWHRAGAPIPKEAVSDFSLALLGALVKAFTPQPIQKKRKLPVASEKW